MRTWLLGALGAAATFTVAPAYAGASCGLGNGVKHVVHLQFDNVHLRRDNPNVPSDMEQLPNLLNFLQNNGVLLANHHTPMSSKTSVDMTTIMTGVYPEKFGFGVGNTFGYFDPTGTPHLTPSFGYWTDVVNEGTTASPLNVPLLVNQQGKTHPAPWVAFTRAGCDVGSFSATNIDFENVTTDVANVYGAPSPQAAEAKANSALAIADFEGIALHCAKGSPLCAASTNAVPDALPDEPNGYTGFSALFGNKYIAPVINSGKPYVNDINGAPVADASTPPNNGFPGFNPNAAQTLGYAAQMLEAGVPVVYLYIEDLHDNHNLPGAPANPDGTFGPGEAGFIYQAQVFNAAFGKFFARLAADGITPKNTIFLVTTDEGDYFAGSSAAATPAGCDGVTTPCAYPTGALGQVDGDLVPLYANEFGNVTSFIARADDAATLYLAGNPSQTSAVTRLMETQAAQMQGFDTIKHADAPVMAGLADQAELALLHALPSDKARWPSFVLYGDPDFYLTASGKTSTVCTPTSDAKSCWTQTRNSVWSHGNFQPEITVTWAALVGPGVRNLGRTGTLFTDHADLRPTLMSLLGLKDDYTHDGRVLLEVMKDRALPASLREDSDLLAQLGAAYKMINAPTGPLGIATLKRLSTPALAGDDTQYARLEAEIVDLTRRRNEIAQAMNQMLENAAFSNEPVDREAAERLIRRAFALLEEVR